VSVSLERLGHIWAQDNIVNILISP